ncbi:MAG: NrfD/PsrC family molybdoenzyme membrane anchor subunit [Vulcanimicrobiaceae bacterium]
MPRSDAPPRIPQPDDAFAGASSNAGFPESPTYFDRPLLKAPHWGWNVVAYLFVGGITGGLGIVAAVARGDRAEDLRLRRAARFAGLALAGLSPLLLISHLGRPERFLNMLRIVKFKSPMSMGVWGLVLYSGAAAGSVARELIDDGTLPRKLDRFVPPTGVVLQALLGCFMSGYTGVLLSATAIPLWGAGKRHIPAASVCSSVAGACAIASLYSALEGNTAVIGRLERLEAVAGLVEMAVLGDFRRVSGAYGSPMYDGPRGRRFRNATLFGGILIPGALSILGGMLKLSPRAQKWRTIACSLLTLAGGYVLRETFIEAGKESAANPHAAFRQPR